MNAGSSKWSDQPQQTRFDPTVLQPPAWAASHQQRFTSSESDKTGSSSRSHLGSSSSAKAADEDLIEDSEDEEVFEDALEDQDVVDSTKARFTTPALEDFLRRASASKDQGNSAFTAKPPDIDTAMQAYRSAIDILPEMPAKQRMSEKASGKAPDRSGIEEITDDEAAEIEAASDPLLDPAKLEAAERERVEEEIRQCQKACWGNLAACHIALKADKEAVEACTNALDIDPDYVKALLRRSAANDRIASWSSLTACQTDYTDLLRLLPPSSPDAIRIRKALQTLPARIKAQQQKETDEMLGKLKELGNGLLGKFGLSTDMFKFHEQPGGGYSMSFDQGGSKE